MHEVRQRFYGQALGRSRSPARRGACSAKPQSNHDVRRCTGRGPAACPTALRRANPGLRERSRGGAPGPRASGTWFNQSDHDVRHSGGQRRSRLPSRRRRRAETQPDDDVRLGASRCAQGAGTAAHVRPPLGTTRCRSVADRHGDFWRPGPRFEPGTGRPQPQPDHDVRQPSRPRFGSGRLAESDGHVRGGAHHEQRGATQAQQFDHDVRPACRTGTGTGTGTGACPARPKSNHAVRCARRTATRWGGGAARSLDHDFRSCGR